MRHFSNVYHADKSIQKLLGHINSSHQNVTAHFQPQIIFNDKVVFFVFYLFRVERPLRRHLQEITCHCETVFIKEYDKFSFSSDFVFSLQQHCSVYVHLSPPLLLTEWHRLCHHKCIALFVFPTGKPKKEG